MTILNRQSTLRLSVLDGQNPQRRQHETQHHH
nr:MAG TPA: hypothetical protein [Caudoviricetes sp.]